MKMRIYFAGAIRGGREDKDLYLQIIELLRKYGEVLTEHVGDPALSSGGEQGDNRFIHDRDLSWLRAADVIVAEVTTPSLGVGYEIGRAVEWGKPVLCLFRPGAGRPLSAMIAGGDRVAVQEYARAEELTRVLETFLRKSG